MAVMKKRTRKKLSKQLNKLIKRHGAEMALALVTGIVSALAADTVPKPAKPARSARSGRAVKVLKAEKALKADIDDRPIRVDRPVKAVKPEKAPVRPVVIRKRA